MANVDYSFNRDRLIGIFLKVNNLSNDLAVDDFDDHFFFEDPIDLGSETPVVFEKPSNNGLDSEFRNTVVHVKAKTVSPYFGRKKLFYNRLSGGDLPDLIVEVVAETTVYEILTKINSKYGLFLTEEDVVDEAIVGTGEISFNLTFKPTSLIFNDHVTMNVTIDGGNASTVYGVDDEVGGMDAALTE